MENIFEAMKKAALHVEALHSLFNDEENFVAVDLPDHQLYKENSKELTDVLKELNAHEQIYGVADRQMIISDLYEYIFLGRAYYAMKSKSGKSKFIKAVLHFVNLLMSYEVLTVSDNLRRKALQLLSAKIPEIKTEVYYSELSSHQGLIGIGKGKSTASNKLEQYFDSILPKTAGGLWHELLVYIFLLRNNCGYIIPNLLTQRWISLTGHIIPPDFLLLTGDKRLFGIEVGTGKERQSGSFTLQTAIPTVAVNTIDSRASDRCPECQRWIQICPHVITNYSDLDKAIGFKSSRVNCLSECSVYKPAEIIQGRCPYTKYRRAKAKTLDYASHDCANNYHYHYQCVLKKVNSLTKSKIKSAMRDGREKNALITHFPYYSGLEVLIEANSFAINDNTSLDEPIELISDPGVGSD